MSWRPKPIDCEKLSEKEILKEVKKEVTHEEGPSLLKMICSIKKFQRLRHEIEMKRATTVTRELHRDHLEHLFELIKEEKVVVGLDKEVIYSFFKINPDGETKIVLELIAIISNSPIF